MKILNSVLTLLILNFSVFAMDAQFQADSLNGSLGDVIRFGWTIDHDDATSISIKDIDMEGTGIEILNMEVAPDEKGSILRFETAVYDSVGLFTFPSSVVYTQSGGNIDSLFLRGPVLEITSILTASDTTFRDIKDLHRIRTPLNLFYFLVILAVLLLSYLAYYLFKRYKKSDSVIITPSKIIVPPEDAHVIALRAFEKLKRSKYLRFEQFKDFHSDLTHILKEYYENRFLIDALELTTSELYEKMQAMSEFEDELTRETKELLEKADFIKFAKGTTNELESGESLNAAIAIVNRTKIQNNQGDNT